MIYIFLAVVSALTLAVAIINKNINKMFDIIEYKGELRIYEEQMKSYDLNDPEQLQDYVDDKNEYDMLVLARNYKTYSAEHLYVYNEVGPIISCLNESEFITKDKNQYNECKSEYDKKIYFLNHFDWKKQLLDKKEENKQEIQRLELAISSGTLKDRESENELKLLKLEKEIIDYRIKKGIPWDNGGLSEELFILSGSYEDYLSKENINSHNRDAMIDKQNSEASYKIAKYKFDNDLLYDTGRTYAEENTATTVKNVFAGGTLTLLFLILVGGGIIAEEFNKGTIKQLLLKPYKRSKIFMSKVFATLILFFLFLVVYGLITAIINGIVFGEIRSIFEPILVYDFNRSKVLEYNIITSCLETFIAILPMFLIELGIAILLGVLTTNTAVAIVVPIAVNTGAGILNMLAKGRIAAWLPSMCWDLSIFLHGALPQFKYSSLPIAIFVDVVCIVLLFGISMILFMKKDIKNQ